MKTKSKAVVKQARKRYSSEFKQQALAYARQPARATIPALDSMAARRERRYIRVSGQRRQVLPPIGQGTAAGSPG